MGVGVVLGAGELLQAAVTSDAMIDRPEQIFEIVGMNGDTLSGFCGFY